MTDHHKFVVNCGEWVVITGDHVEPQGENVNIAVLTATGVTKRNQMGSCWMNVLDVAQETRSNLMRSPRSNALVPNKRDLNLTRSYGHPNYTSRVGVYNRRCWLSVRESEATAVSRMSTPLCWDQISREQCPLLTAGMLAQLCKGEVPTLHAIVRAQLHPSLHLSVCVTHLAGICLWTVRRKGEGR